MMLSSLIDSFYLVDKVLLVNPLADKRVLLKSVTVFTTVRKFSLLSLLHLHEKALYLQSLRLFILSLIYLLFHILMC